MKKKFVITALLICGILTTLIASAMQRNVTETPGATANNTYFVSPSSSENDVEDVDAETDIEDVSVDAEDATPVEVNDNLENSTPKALESEPAEAPESSAAEAVQPTPPASCDYCGSINHPYSHCAQRSIDNGAYGRWVIPSVGINVAVYCTFSPSQAIADAVDSANYIPSNSMAVLADHSNQDFCTLKNVSIGTMAYMDFGSYQQEYICTDFSYGHRTDAGNITDDNYNLLYPHDYNSGTILCQTCNGCWQNIILVSFQPVFD